MCSREKSQDQACQSSSLNLFAWKKESCVINNGNEVIREIFELGDDALIPQDLFAKYSSEQIATTLIYRYFQKHERPHFKESDVINPGFDVYSQGQSVLAFSTRHINSIIKNGLLNQFVSGTRPRRENYLDMRVAAEASLATLKLSEGYSMGDLPINHVRPKYAYFSVKPTGAAFVRNSFSASYGDTMAVLKDSLKKRTTLTNTDSLAGHVTKNNSMRKMSFYHLAENFSFPSVGTYYEAQIWGPISIHDVAYFLADCFNTNSKAELIEALEQAGVKVPVYSCKMVYSNGASYPTPENLLYGVPLFRDY
nr:hypothetical protein [uncultured Bdellovibrio sp.]